MEIIKDHSLKRYNTFGIDAKAKFFVEAKSVEELSNILEFQNFKNEEKLILGGGSNILFTKDFDGLVIKNSIKGIDIIDQNEDFVFVKANSGEVWDEFVEFCVNKNFGGLENLSLIPGTVGASPIQNIGAYGTEIKDVFYELEALNVQNKSIEKFNLDDCNFGYRNSVFKCELKGKFVIISVTFKLQKNPKINLEYAALKNEIQNFDTKEISIKDIRDAVIKIRQSKLPDPEIYGNAGSFFKNPEIEKKHFENLKNEFPDIIGYGVSSNKIKVPAGWLIQKSGWRGKRVGNTGSFEKQALVLVNYGNATGEEIKNLSEEIKRSIKDKFNINLETEVNII